MRTQSKAFWGLVITAIVYTVLCVFILLSPTIRNGYAVIAWFLALIFTMFAWLFYDK